MKNEVKNVSKKVQKEFLAKIGKGNTNVPVCYFFHPRNEVISREFEAFAYSEISQKEYVGQPFECLFEGPDEEDTIIYFLDLDTDPDLIRKYGWERVKATPDEDFDMPIIQVETKDYESFNFKFTNHHLYLNRTYKDIFMGKPVKVAPRVTE